MTLTNAHLKILKSLLNGRKELRQKEISAKTGISGTNLSRELKLLEAFKTVSRRRNGRAIYVSLTPKGENIVKKHVEYLEVLKEEGLPVKE